jgi:hypothetical protein
VHHFVPRARRGGREPDHRTAVEFEAAAQLRPDNAREKWEPLVEAVTAFIGLDPDAFALAAYDVFRCEVTLRPLAGTNDLADWKSYLTFAAESFFGTRLGRLNANGDRAFGDYEFWAVRNVDGKTQWVSVARMRTGRSTRDHNPCFAPGSRTPNVPM